jgi:hypothetical protein
MMQQVIVGLLVLAAATFIARKMWRAIAAARAPKGAGCDSGCGCVAPTSSRAVHEPVKH